MQAGLSHESINCLTHTLQKSIHYPLMFSAKYDIQVVQHLKVSLGDAEGHNLHATLKNLVLNLGEVLEFWTQWRNVDVCHLAVTKTTGTGWWGFWAGPQTAELSGSDWASQPSAEAVSENDKKNVTSRKDAGIPSHGAALQTRSLWPGVIWRVLSSNLDGLRQHLGLVFQLNLFRFQLLHLALQSPLVVFFG